MSLQFSIQLNNRKKGIYDEHKFFMYSLFSGTLIRVPMQKRITSKRARRRKFMRRKLTKHVLGRVAQQIGEWQDMIAETTGIHKKVYGIYFSNEGAKGREPLFDASVNGTKDIFAYWEDEENGIICISAPDPGYEIRAPKSMDFIFSWYMNYPQILLKQYLRGFL